MEYDELFFKKEKFPQIYFYFMTKTINKLTHHWENQHDIANNKYSKIIKK